MEAAVVQCKKEAYTAERFSLLTRNFSFLKERRPVTSCDLQEEHWEVDQ